MAAAHHSRLLLVDPALWSRSRSRSRGRVPRVPPTPPRREPSAQQPRAPAVPITPTFSAPRRTVATPPPVVQAELIADDLQQLMTVYADLRREIHVQSRQIYAMRTETRRLNSQVSRMYADLERTTPMRLASYGPP